MPKILTDSYDRKARLYPAILLVAPAVFTASALLYARLSVLHSSGTAILGCGGAFLLTQLARDAGKSREKALFERWGGMPSIAIFRHCDTRIDEITKNRLHKRLSSFVKGAKAPSSVQEKEDPLAADAVYSAWSNYLRANTRDTVKFALLFKENISYGYRRNIYGLRGFGITVSLLSSATCGIRVCFVRLTTGTIDDVVCAAGTFSIILLVLWCFRFTADWARIPADAYAARLAECVETLGSTVAPTAAGK